MKTLGMCSLTVLAWTFAFTSGYAYGTPRYRVNVIVAACLLLVALALLWRVMG